MMKKTPLIIWIPLIFLLKIYAWLRGHRVIKKVKIKGPAITLSNHTSFYDFIYTTIMVYPRRNNYLAAKKMFYDPLLSFFLRLARAIPKSLLEPDPVATMSALKVLKKGGILSIFPEGQISQSGVLLEPSFSIAKLIKKAAVPLYIIKHYNAYFANPPWTKKTFRGRVQSESYLLLTKDDIKTLSEQDIYQKVCDALSHNAHDYNLEHQYKYRISDLKGLDDLLYLCPDCQRETLVIKNRVLSCTSCSHHVKVDHHFRFQERSIYDYYTLQVRTLDNELEKNPSFSLQATVTLQSFRDKRLINVGTGVIDFSQESYIYRGKIDGVEMTLTFDPRLIPSLPSDIGRNIQIYKNGQIYQFEFTDRKLPTKFVILSEVIYKRVRLN